MALKFIFEDSVLRVIHGLSASDLQGEANSETSVIPNSSFVLLAEFLRLPRERKLQKRQ